MPTTRQRNRHLAITRKGAYETDFLFAEEESDYSAPQILSFKDTNVKMDSTTTPSSPTSIASTLDPLPPEMKAMLPGAWVIVGKGGKPLKNENEKMYDDPIQILPAKTKKKKQQQKKKQKKTRTDSALAEPEPLLVVLEEAASSSKCLQDFERKSTQRSKQLERSKDLKYWAGYQRAKQLKRGALDELVAALMLTEGEAEGEAEGLGEAAAARVTRKKAMKDNKANSNQDKARRRARSAAVAGRCCIWDDDEPSSVPVSIESDVEERPASPWFKVQMSGELQLCFGPKTMPEPKPPGAWTSVGKRGKSLTAFPPLQPRDMAEEAVTKRRESLPAEASDNKRRKSLPQTKADKLGKTMQCSVM